MWGVADDEHGTRRRAKERLGGAAQEEPREAGTPVGSHHDDRRVPRVRFALEDVVGAVEAPHLGGLRALELGGHELFEPLGVVPDALLAKDVLG